MQTQRTILLIIFSMSLLLLWDAWQKHNGQPSMFAASPGAKSSAGAAGSSSATSTGTAAARRGPEGSPAADIPRASNQATPTTASGESAAAADTVSSATAGLSGATTTSRTIVLRNDVLALTIDTLGGTITRAELLRYRDAEQRQSQAVLLTAGAGKTYLAQTGLIGSPAWPTHRTPFVPATEQTVVEASADRPADLTLTGESGGVTVVKRFTLTNGSYQLGVTHEVQNTSENAVTPSIYLQLTRDAHKPPGESQFYSTYTGPAVYTEESKFQKIDFADIEKGKVPAAKTVADGWTGMIQHYFVAAWVPPSKAEREFFARKIDTGLYAVGAIQPLGALQPGARTSSAAVLYVGPQNQHVLEQVAPGLDLVVDYGWLTVIAKPLYWLLETLHGLVGNWGWAIVLLTIVVKLAFFPLQAASYRSIAKMKQVTPKMTALRERFGDDRIKLNQAMMELYKTEKVNPMAGCLPVVVQIPVFISLYWVLLASVEMRDAPWVGWIQDLATPDPYYVLPLIMAATMVLQTKLNPTPPDPVQAKVMMVMPLIFSVMFFFFPAGLVLYWLVNNVFSIAQQWVITRQVEHGSRRKT